MSCLSKQPLSSGTLHLLQNAQRLSSRFSPHQVQNASRQNPDTLPSEVTRETCNKTHTKQHLWHTLRGRQFAMRLQRQQRLKGRQECFSMAGFNIMPISFFLPCAERLHSFFALCSGWKHCNCELFFQSLSLMASWKQPTLSSHSTQTRFRPQRF